MSGNQPAPAVQAALLRTPPLREIIRVEADAEKICGNETELGSANADDANYNAVHSRYDPAVPHLFTD